MDVETAAAVSELGVRIDAFEQSLREEMSSMKGEISSMKNEISSMTNEMATKADLALLKKELRDEFQAGLSDARRHTTVLFESLSDDIRIVAEGVASIATRLDKRP